MSVVMKKSQNNVLPFPKRPEEPGVSTIIVRIGNERFAIHWKTEDLPPAAPLLPWKPGAKNATVKIVK
jgi:hypothetical protein